MSQSIPTQGSVIENRLRLRRLAWPLAFVFWGAVFVFVDIRFGLRIGDRFASVDILPNFVGLGLLAIGTVKLAFGGG